MGADEIRYRLPSSRVKINATITFTTDAILDRTDKSRVTAIALETGGAESDLRAKITHGFFRDTNLAIELAEDGRLVSSSVESVGAAGRALIGVVSAGVTIAGLAMGSPAVVAVGAAGVTGSTKTTVAEKEDGKRAQTDEEKIAAAYATKFSAVAARQKQYATLAILLGIEEAKAVGELLAATTAATRETALKSVASYETAAGHVRQELERLETHFKAWRATTITTRTELHELFLPIDTLRLANVAVENGEVRFPDSPAGDKADDQAKKDALAAVKKVWSELGLVVVLGQGTAGTLHKPSEHAADNTIVVRFPRRATLTLYKEEEKKAGDAAAASGPKNAVLVESKSYLVMDNTCELQTLQFRNSVFAKRSSAFKFSTIGALTGFSSNSTATGAALADTAQTLPGTIGTSLEQSKKIYDQLSAIKSRGLDDRLAQIKKEIDLKQQEITATGLLWTEAARVELDRLKLEADTLQQRKTIGELGPSADSSGDLASIKLQIELLKAHQELGKIKAEREALRESK